MNKYEELMDEKSFKKATADIENILLNYIKLSADEKDSNDNKRFTACINILMMNLLKVFAIYNSDRELAKKYVNAIFEHNFDNFMKQYKDFENLQCKIKD